MEGANLLANLNPTQREAVTAPGGNILVLAGAGTGKTRVLVQRIAWLLREGGVYPSSILAVTFSNKAANQMRQRLEELVGFSKAGSWIGTFHGLSHRLLRTHAAEAGLIPDFQILDAEDQLRLLKRVIQSINLDEKRWSPRQAAAYINAKKEGGLRPHELDGSATPHEAVWLKIYHNYQQTCERASLVDFAELLLRGYELWLANPQILNYYQNRFKNILVDEFQDTNIIQYNWVRLLAGESSSVMIVGDDDQAIYGWRGACVANIQRFLRDFKSVATFRLEQNYRSSQRILQAANHLISGNMERLGKNLWSDGSLGEPIELRGLRNELDEADFIAVQIRDHQSGGGRLRDCAILYRNNAQSRLLEDRLLRSSIPYHIYGGMRFFERQEIKDALAYLRLIANRDDDAAFERVINIPARGIGDRTLAVLRLMAREQKRTMWQTALSGLQQATITGRAAAALQRFLELINALAEGSNMLSLADLTQRVVMESGLWQMYQYNQGEVGQSRLENLAELVTATSQFTLVDSPDQHCSQLQTFLSYAVLESGSVGAAATSDAVQLMTLHSAKGLEFPRVFIVGMEEGLFPSQRALANEADLEEERRLAYVGITRAMDKLTLTHVGSRLLYGKVTSQIPSRFIAELPDGAINAAVGMLAEARRVEPRGRFFRRGEVVYHPTIGRGRVISTEGSGARCHVQVDFEEHGVKWLIASYLQPESAC